MVAYLVLKLVTDTYRIITKLEEEMMLQWGVLVKPVRKAWGYMKDPLVPWWVKLIPILVVVYVLSPLDILPDAIIGLGQLDDIGIILIGLKLFFTLIPKPVIDSTQEKMSGKKGVHPDAEDLKVEEGEFEEV